MKRIASRNNSVYELDFIKKDSLEISNLIKKIKDGNYDGLDLKLMNLLSLYAITIGDNKELLEEIHNIINNSSIRGIKDLKKYFNSINIVNEEYKLESNIIELTNCKDNTIISFIKRTESINILVVCNLLDKYNFYSFDSCGKISGNVILSNYDSPERELDELILRPYEAIVYEI